MLNWRKPLIYILLHLSGSQIPKNLKEIRRIEKFSEKDKEIYQKDKLEKLLLYASQNVPYYKRILHEAGVVRKEHVFLENFERIPFLTKDIIQEKKSLLHSKKKRRKVYENTSGGSTGQPVKFLQDAYYNDWNNANKLYFFNEFFGKEIGETEINLWGSERDIHRNSIGLREKVINLLYNRTFLNDFKTFPRKYNLFVDEINKKKPVSMWVYVESIDALANHIIRKKLTIHSPKFIISTAGTLYPEIRAKVEKVFKCPLYNQYGSREVGAIAIECQMKNGLHDFFWMNKLEIINSQIYITTLNNFSMPLIRYKIGDIAECVKNFECKCGRSNLKIKTIKGREINHFKTRGKELIHGQYFIHQFYYKKWVRKFQVIQSKLNLIEIYIVGEKNTIEMDEIENNIKLVMGKNCKINWRFVNDISPSKSGKYLYTICKIK